MLIFPQDNLMQNIIKTLLELFCFYMSCMNFPFILQSNSCLLSSRINIYLRKLQTCDAGRLMSPGNTFHLSQVWTQDYKVRSQHPTFQSVLSRKAVAILNGNKETNILSYQAKIPRFRRLSL